MVCYTEQPTVSKFPVVLVYMHIYTHIHIHILTHIYICVDMYAVAHTFMFFMLRYVICNIKHKLCLKSFVRLCARTKPTQHESAVSKLLSKC